MSKHKHELPTSKKRLEPLRLSFDPPTLETVQHIEMTVCRSDHRLKLGSRELFGRENDQKAANKMAFLLAGQIFNELKRLGDGPQRPQFNQVEAHLALTRQELKGVRLSHCFEGKTKDADLEQAREAIKFLLVGVAPDEASIAAEVAQSVDPKAQPDEYRTRLAERQEAFACWRRIDDVFFRTDEHDQAAGPRFFLRDRRLFSTPCSPSELAVELTRPARKLAYGLAAKVEIVWVLGPAPYLRADLSPPVAEAVEFVARTLAGRKGSALRFIYTDARPACWGLDPAAPLPSATLDALAKRLQAQDPPVSFLRHGVPGTATGDTGHWTFLNPGNQMIYANVEGHNSMVEEYLYLLRAYSQGEESKRPMPFVSAANPKELRLFRAWFEEVTRRYDVTID